MDNCIEEKINANENQNIAFINLNETPILKLELINRNIDKQDNIIKEEIEKQLDIEYTTYAITLNGKNKTYLSTKEDAEKIINELKEEYGKVKTEKLGIVQVFSEDYKDIKAIETKEASNLIEKEIKKETKTNSSVKVAKTKKSTNSTKKVEKIAKASSVKGIKFSVKPVSGIITSRYGRRSSPGGIGSTNHKGLDIAAKLGTPIYATADGRVSFAGKKGSLGNLVIINHGNGVQTYYAHCSKLNVSKGQKINASNKIAEVGKTGVATGYHLHFEIHVNGTVVNPQKYVY